MAKGTQPDEASLARLVVDEAADALLALSPDGTILFWNRGAERIFGHASEGATGRSLEGLIVPPDLRDEWRRELERTLASGSALFQTTRHARDGSIVEVSVSMRAVGEPGADRRVVAGMKDVTRLMRMKEASTTDLARSNADLEQFAYLASHDMKEPLRMVASYVQLLEKKYKDKLGPDADKYIAYAVDGVRRMQELIGALLDYSRLASDEPRGSVELDVALRRAIENLGRAIEESGMQIVVEALPAVRGDLAQLTQLFQNLIDNAIKYRRSDEAPRIEIAARLSGPSWTVAVRDNGIGFEPEHGERIFRIFQRLHARSEYSGSGIGLAIARKIVERHGGRLWAESSLGSGSTFSFTLPAMET